MKKKLSRLLRPGLITCFVAMLCFVVLSSLDVAKSWMAFIYAIPASGIVALSLNSAWHDFRRNKLFVSIIIWGGLLSIYLSLLLFLQVNIWKLFLLGIPGQAAVLLWGRLFHKTKEIKDE